MRRFIIILSIILSIELPVMALAQEPAGGVINGQVVNGTEGGGSVAGVEVTLLTYIDGVLAETRTIRTDEEGKFQFANVALGHTYLVSARYMGVDYYYPATFSPEETEKFVEVGVCDVTASDEAIRIGLAYAVIDIAEESLQVTEVFWLVNEGDMTYAGEDGVLVFTLPEGAHDFTAPQELMPDYQFLGNNRVGYIVPFPPGERQLIYSYMLAKPDSGELTISLEIDYPADIFELMVAGEDIEVAVTQLAPAEPVVTDSGERFIHFRGENLARGSVLDLLISDVSKGHGMSTIILWVVMAVVIVGIAVYWLRKRVRVNRDE
jgi:hypothetical protein